jgi:peptidoglycan/LPS O-acetylase OafA/YrhL
MSRRDDAHDSALDGLRAVAVLLVVVHHWIAPGVPGFDFGLTGVRLFFALSGFLITRILLDARDAIAAGDTTFKHVVRSFYARRALRIFPLYYAALAVLWIADASHVRSEIVWHATYSTSLLVAHLDHWIGAPSHFWSLSVEEQFYLFWPWVMLCTPSRWSARVCVLVFAAGPLWRTIGVLENAPHFVLLHTLPGCLDALGAGAILAHTRRRTTPSAGDRVAWSMLIAGSVILALSWVSVRGTDLEWLPRLVSAQRGMGWSLVLASLVGHASRGAGPFPRMLSPRPLAYVGRVSYAIYVVHPLMPQIFARVGIVPTSRPLQLLLWAVVTLALSGLSWRYFEGPINALKSRFSYRLTREHSA